jgi:hypothetical protein
MIKGTLLDGLFERRSPDFELLITELEGMSEGCLVSLTFEQTAEHVLVFEMLKYYLPVGVLDYGV